MLNKLFFIQVFPNGLGTNPRLDYTLEESQFEIRDSMIHLKDPKSGLEKKFPTSITIIDEVRRK